MSEWKGMDEMDGQRRGRNDNFCCSLVFFCVCVVVSLQPQFSRKHTQGGTEIQMKCKQTDGWSARERQEERRTLCGYQRQLNYENKYSSFSLSRPCFACPAPEPQLSSDSCRWRLLRGGRRRVADGPEPAEGSRDARPRGREELGCRHCLARGEELRHDRHHWDGPDRANLLHRVPRQEVQRADRPDRRRR